MMHINNLKKYYFINEFNYTHLINLNKNISFIWRNKDKEDHTQTLIELSKFCDYLFLVGDDLQNIYSFRGSNNDIIQNIKNYFEDISLEKMTINYRSTPEIINLANKAKIKMIFTGIRHFNH